MSEADRGRGVLLFVDVPQDKAARYSDQINEVLAQASLPAGLAAKMAGRWDHASAVALGRSGRAFAWPLRDRAKSPRLNTLTDLLKAALRGFQVFLTAHAPMPVYTDLVARRTFLVFVDTARRDLDWHSYRLGGVIWSPAVARCFTLDVAVTATGFLPEDSSNAINEAEALAALVAIQNLHGGIAEAEVMMFIDNQAAEGVLIKAYSRSAHLTAIAAAFWTAVRRSGSACWIGRVPSELNVADGFSRADFAAQSRLGLTWAEVSIPQPDNITWLPTAAPPKKRQAAADAAARKDKRRQRHQGR